MTTQSNQQLQLFESPDRYPAITKTTLRNAVRFYSTKCFSLPAPLTVQYFRKYYLLYWTGSYLLDQIRNGSIHHNGSIYSIEYKRGLTRGKILANMEDQFALSFREPNGELDLPSIVIISGTSKSRTLQNGK